MDTYKKVFILSAFKHKINYEKSFYCTYTSQQTQLYIAYH